MAGKIGAQCGEFICQSQDTAYLSEKGLCRGI